MNSRRVLIGALIGCGSLTLLALLLFAAVMCGASIGMQKAKERERTETNEEETTNTPPKRKAGSVKFMPVVLRVSGDQGTSYTCMYGTEALEDDEVVHYTQEESGTLDSAPVDYSAQIVSESSSRAPSRFHASCSIPPTPRPSDKGRLKAQVLVNDSVKDEDETRPDPPGKTSQKSSSVTVDYWPLCEDPKAKSKLKSC